MADMILLGLAIICTAYFMVIVFYAGMGTSFAFIWLFFAALCVFLVYGKWYYRKNMDRIPQWVPVSIVTTCIAGVVIMAALCIMVFMGAAASEERDLDYVIVLGARVKEHTVSNSLKKRLDKAIENTLLSSSLLMRNSLAPLFLCSSTIPSEFISSTKRRSFTS